MPNNNSGSSRLKLSLVFVLLLVVLLLGLKPLNSLRSNPIAAPTIESSRTSSQATFRPVVDDSKREEATNATIVAPSVDAFGAFSNWIVEYQKAASNESRSALLQKGKALAAQRRLALETLIQNDPETALKSALTFMQRQELPAEIASLLEKRIDGIGTYSVAASLPIPGGKSSSMTRTVSVNGQNYNAYAYGRRKDQTTKENIPLHGIVIGDSMALHESPIRILAAGELPDPSKRIANPDGVCPVKGVVSRAVTVDAGDTIYYTCCDSCPDALASKLASAESGNGPHVNGAGTAGATGTSWTIGAKTVLFIRVDFSDLAGEPLTQAAAETLINTTVNNFYVDCSYNQTSMTCTATTQVFRLPQLSTYYANNFGALMTDSRAAANAAGYNDGSYNLDVVGCKYLSNGAAGIGYVGGKGCALEGEFDLRVAAHELGHNYGVSHANYWATTDGTTIGAGANDEYGDPFTVMGGNGDPTTHFNEQMKNKFNWLPTAQVTSITTSGTYRIYAHDQALGTNIGAFKVAKTGDASGRVYWGGFRQKITGNNWLMNGVELRWAPWASSNGGPQLLDTTPGTSGGKNDSSITIGRTYSDTAAGLYITPIGLGGTTPESIDVVVNMGTFANNRSPVISSLVCNPAYPQTATMAALTCTASDPDGDSMAYYWDFGDGTFSTTNSATQSKSWAKSGGYTVTCTVSDLKSMSATSTVFVGVLDPGTYLVTGNITSNGSPLAGVVVSDGTRSGTSDASGNYAVVSVPNGTYTLTPTLPGGIFTPTTQSVAVVGGNVGGKNFTATVMPAPLNGPGTGITRDWWTGITGTNVTDLTTNAAYPNNPTGTETLTTVFEGPTNFGDNYGTRIRGYFYAPTTGSYYFYIASDDSSELWLSADSTVAKAVKIASVSGYTSSRQWTKFASQKSAAISLVAGQKYFIQALHKEGTGGDNIAVGVQLPYGFYEQPIPAHRLDPWVTPTVAFAATASSGSEAISPVLVPVNLSAATSVPVAVDYAVTGGTATGGGVDYLLANGTLIFPAGTTTQNISIAVVNDTLMEADETIVITLSAPNNATLGAKSVHTFTIIDDDNTPPVATAVSLATTKNVAVACTLPATDVNGDSLTYSVVAQPAHGTVSGTAPNLTYTPAQNYFGSDSFTFKANDGHSDSNVATVSLSIVSPPPTLASAPTATPLPALVGQTISFSSAATDAGGSALTYAWNFGDGSSGTDATASHSYGTAGVYLATVTITNTDGSSASAKVEVQVNSPGGGTGAGVDTDGDGVSDVNEILDGTDPNDPNSLKKIPMIVSALAGKVSLSIGGKDSVSVSGIIPNLPAKFNPTGVVMKLNVGGIPVSFTLDSKGKGPSSAGTIQLSFKPAVRNKTTRTIEFKGGPVAFKALLHKGTWAKTWGLGNTNATMTITTDLTINGRVYTSPVDIHYSAKAGVSGRFQK